MLYEVITHFVRIALGLAITLLFIGHAARYYEVPFITQLDNIIYDARLRLTMPGGDQGWGRPNLSSSLAFGGGSPTSFVMNRNNFV